MLITKHEEVTKQGFSKIHGRLFEVGANSRLGAYSNKYGSPTQIYLKLKKD